MAGAFRSGFRSNDRLMRQLYNERLTLETLDRLSMTFTANGKTKFPFRQNTKKPDLIKLLSCLLSRYIE